MKKVRISRELLFNIFVLIIFVIFTGYVALHHEIWSDEAQSWLISRDLSIVEIFKEMKYEGHSMLWNLILIPFIKLGFPYEYFNLISCAIVGISVYIILFKIQISKIIKLLIIFSEPYIYFYTVISRCYCLIPLLVSILIMLEKNKEKNIYLHAFILALLSNVHAIIIPFVIAVVLEDYVSYIKKYKKENNKELLRKYVVSLGIVIIGIVIFIIQVIDLKSSIVVEEISNKKSINTVVYSILDTCRNICFYYIPYQLATILFIILFILMIIVSIYYKKQSIIFYISLVGIIIANYIVVFCSKVQRSQAIIIVLFYITVKIYKNKKEKIPKYVNKIAVGIYIVICVSSTIDAIPSIKNEITESYSCSKETMEYINNNYGDGYNICCFTNYLISTSLVPYSKHEYTFFDLVNNRQFTYYHWDKGAQDYADIRMHEIVERIEAQLKNTNKILLVVSSDMDYLCNFIKVEFNIILKYTSGKVFQSKNNLEEEFLVYELYEY